MRLKKHGLWIGYISLFMLIATLLIFRVYMKNTVDDGIEFVIGVSQANLTEPWRITMTEEIKEEAEKYGHVSLIITDAAKNTQKQIKDVNKLMDYDIDLLIISPNESRELTPVLAECYKEIPVIVLDRAVEGYDYTLYIGPDNYLIGQQAGELIAEMLPNKKGKVMEIQGLSDSPPVVDRSKGLHDVLNRYDDISVEAVLEANWSRDIAEDRVKAYLNQQGMMDIIFAHNDEMAYGAHRGLNEKNYRDKVKVIGVDGLEGEDGGIRMLSLDRLDGTFICPTGGKYAMQYGMSILQGEKGIPKKIILRSKRLTKEQLEPVEFYKSETTNVSDRKIKLGFIQVGSESKWRKANSNSIKKAATENNIELLFVDANQSQEKQIDTIRHFIREKVDVIAMSPVVATGWNEVLKEVKEAKIPIILSDRAVNVEDASLYTTFIGADFEEEGRRGAKWVIEYSDVIGTVDIVEIRGTAGADPVIGRSKGFKELIENNSRMSILNSKSSDFTLEGGRRVMEEFLRDYGKEIDVVYAHNDDMAIGAIQAIEEFGLKPGSDIKIVSVDGTKEAFNAMIKGKLNCTVECNPLLGPVLIKAVKDVVSGKQLPIRIITEEGVFTQENAKHYIHQREY